VARAGVAFVLPSLGGLALLDRWAAPWVLPPEFAPLAARVPGPAGGPDGTAVALLAGTAAGVAASAALALLFRRRGRPVPAPGDAGWLVPREPAELPWGLLMAAVAAAAEELFFRLYLPLLVALATGSVIAGAAAATLLFARLHRYQGGLGAAAAGLYGLFLFWAYLVTGHLWVAAALHAAVDLNGLVLRPWLSGFRRLSAG
jgi:membrane protease YdiL (CAAX protease family)